MNINDVRNYSIFVILMTSRKFHMYMYMYNCVYQIMCKEKGQLSEVVITIFIHVYILYNINYNTLYII